MRDDRFIDQAIDDTARALSEGEPRVDVRANISARMAGERLSVAGYQLSVVGYRLSVVRAAMAAGVAAALIVAVTLWPSRVEQAPPREAAAPELQSTQVGRALLGPPKPGEGGSGSPGEPDRVRPTSAVAEIDVPVGNQLEPIEIETLDTYELTLDAVELPMITVEAIDISAMDVPQ